MELYILNFCLNKGIKIDEKGVAVKLRSVKYRINEDLRALKKPGIGKIAGQKKKPASWFHHASFMYDAV